MAHFGSHSFVSSKPQLCHDLPPEPNDKNISRMQSKSATRNPFMIVLIHRRRLWELKKVNKFDIE